MINQPKEKQLVQGEERRNKLTLYISVLVTITGLVILCLDAYSAWSKFPNAISVGPFIITLVGLIAILFWHFKYYSVAKFLISIFPVILLQAHQLAVGAVINEYFFWFPYALVASSLIPPLVYSIRNNRAVYFTSIGFYLIAIFFIDDIMLKYSNPELTIIPIVEQNRFFYGVIPVAIFLFVQGSIFFLKSISAGYLTQLELTNEQLLESRDDIAKTLESVEKQQEIIENRNIQISELNELLKDKISHVSDELNTKNALIADYLFKNSHDIRGPVASILGLINLLDIKNLSMEEKEDILLNVKKSCEELDQKIREINRHLE